MKTIELKNWILPKYLSPSFLTKAGQQFSVEKPFSHLALSDFFLPLKLDPVISALQKEKFHLKEADLFTFYQTHDLNNTKNKIIRDFREFLCSPVFVQYLSEITNILLVPRRIDLAGTLYTSTHHLLPHDDDLEERKVAFMVYLSTLAKSDGGALAFYDSRKGNATKIVKRIKPKKNTFVIFGVSKISFHEVEEVRTSTHRAALSGWFYDQ